MFSENKYPLREDKSHQKTKISGPPPIKTNGGVENNWFFSCFLAKRKKQKKTISEIKNPVIND